MSSVPIIQKNQKQYDTNLLFKVWSSKLGGSYECHRFREYSIDLDLETDTQAFDFVFKNVNYVDQSNGGGNYHGGYISLFAMFDKVEIYLNDVPIIRGRIDEVKYVWEAGDSYIHVTGRCVGAALVDNNCLPTTLQNVKPNAYIQERCGEYGINCKIDGQLSLVKERIIGVGETEISVINDMIKSDNLRYWMDYDTFNVGKWNDTASPQYTFTCGVQVNGGIPILSLELTEDGSEVYSESIVYGSTSDGSDKVLGTYKNDAMISHGVKRRVTLSNTNNDDTSKYKANAEDDVRYGFDNCHGLIITVKTPKKGAIKPNTCAVVIDYLTRMHAVFFIKSVTYQKDLTNGSTTKITMVPSKAANDAMYGAQFSLAGGLTGKGKMTMEEVMKSRKG